MLLRDTNGEAVASLRGILLASPVEIETLFDVRLRAECPCPVLALDRLVILPSHRRRGLSSLFRYYLYQSCVGSGIESIAFTINEGSSRIAMQEKLGFRFSKADTSHREHSPYNNSTDILFGNLAASDFPRAVEIVAEHLLMDLSSVVLAPNFIPGVQSYFESVLAFARTPQ